MCGDPADGYLVVPGNDLAANLDSRDGEALALTQIFSSHPADGGGRVDKNREAVAALLTLVYDSECLVDSKDLRLEDLLVYAEMEVPAGPATG